MGESADAESVAREDDGFQDCRGCRTSAAKRKGATTQTSETVEDAPGSKPRLKRALGLWMAVALVVGNMVGSGTFLLPASLATVAGGVGRAIVGSMAPASAVAAAAG
jgi:hypothetical protein